MISSESSLDNLNDPNAMAQAPEEYSLKKVVFNEETNLRQMKMWHHNTRRKLLPSNKFNLVVNICFSTTKYKFNPFII